MKKLLALILAGIMAFSMVACGGGETNEGGEVSGEGSAETEDVGSVAESSYDITKLSTFGLPEPSFSYSYKHYEEVNIRDDDGNILSTHPKYVFDISSADNAAIYGYMEEVYNAGWGSELPHYDSGSFRYNPENDDYQINIAYEENGASYIFVLDFTKTCVYDESTDIYVIEELGEYGTYGKYIYG